AAAATRKGHAERARRARAAAGSPEGARRAAEGERRLLRQGLPEGGGLRRGRRARRARRRGTARKGDALCRDGPPRPERGRARGRQGARLRREGGRIPLPHASRLGGGIGAPGGRGGGMGRRPGGGG